MMCLILASLTSLGGAADLVSQPSAPSVIPLPAQVEMRRGAFRPERGVRVIVSRAFAATSGQIGAALKSLAPRRAETLRHAMQAPAGGAIAFQHEPDLIKVVGAEGYEMTIGTDGVLVRAPEPAGAFYAAKTLEQLLWHQRELPAMHIVDRPRFAWRGMMLDCCRHFFPIAFVKRFIDWLALHKFNRFHWHLTEDQGWRIEIKKYPRLTQVGAVRKQSMVGRYSDNRFDGKPYGGYYTQDEIRDVVAYAKARFITVMPEIEMPGHALASLAAHPENSCTGGPFEVGVKWGVYEDIYCAGQERTFEFLQDVLTEVLDLFPSEYVHIGGDEAPKTRWKACAKCQRRIKAEGLADEHELQSYFVGRIGKWLAERGRRLVGWDEILEGGLPAGATVMSWRGENGGIAAARAGHDVIMAPTTYTYFDYYQSKNTDSEPIAIGGFLPLQTVYGYDPIPAVLTPEQAPRVLGAQAQIWTEYIPTTSQVEYMAFPRMCALSEVLWTPVERKSYEGFLQRLEPHLATLGKQGVNFRPLDKP